MLYFLLYIFFINIYGIFIMHHDKALAIKGKFRVPEIRLFTIAFILGSPGILFGMFMFHHKTRHAKFRLGIPLILLLQLYLLFRFDILKL